MSDRYMDLDPESASIQTHLGIMQGVIQRMSSNSSSCKAWCVTLVSAVLVLVSDRESANHVWIALLPTVVFGALDAYYLALEKAFRKSYNDFVSKVHRRKLKEEDLYVVEPTGSICSTQLKAMKSFSVWGFYLALIVFIFILKATAFA